MKSSFYVVINHSLPSTRLLTVKGPPRPMSASPSTCRFSKYENGELFFRVTNLSFHIRLLDGDHPLTLFISSHNIFTSRTKWLSLFMQIVDNIRSFINEPYEFRLTSLDLNK